MIYLLRGLYGTIRQSINPNPYQHPAQVGQWWFDMQEPEWTPVIATAAEIEDDGDSDEPMPAPYGNNRPRCKSCGGPNFSAENARCITCRLGMG